MEQYINKSALVVLIEKYYNECLKRAKITDSDYWNAKADAYRNVLAILDDTLEVKEVDEQKERMSECPYRQVGCTMYEGKILECNGACSWVVDYPRLKELKAQKGEKV